VFGELGLFAELPELRDGDVEVGIQEHKEKIAIKSIATVSLEF
jgi:hypothetical protein